MQPGPSINRRFQSTLLCAIRLLSAQAAGGPAGDNGPDSYGYDPTTGSLASKAGVSCTYGDAQHKHAVTGLSNGSSFSYDANGSMITRSVGGRTFNLSYDAENRMTGVTGAATANFVYDDSGARVIATEGVTTTVYVGSYFEWHGSISDTVKYYYAGTVRVAMRKGDGHSLFLLGDHLGSTNRLVHADGTPVTPGGMRLYKAWGESRYEPDGELTTEYRYTGQFEQQSIGVNWYGSRWYDPALSRWVQPDQIVPVAQQGTQAWDRFAFVNNSSLNFTDPTGHFACGDGIDDPRCDQYDQNIYGDIWYTFDSKEFVESILPWDPQDLRKFSKLTDYIALGADSFAEGIVLYFVSIGAACGLTFEGNPVTGLGGAGAGWIIGETNPIVSGLVFVGNVSATASSAASIGADFKSGSSQLHFQISNLQNQTSVNGSISVDSNTIFSGLLTTLGWGIRIVEGSLAIQTLAILNDHNKLPTFSLSAPFNIRFPFR